MDELGRRIVRGDFAATGILPIEPQLAAELGVSRNLLREAVKVLASKGLVDVGPRSGTRVRPQPDWHLLDPDVLAWLDAVGARLERAFGLVEFRLIVEPPASYLAALRATDERPPGDHGGAGGAGGLRRSTRARAGARHRLPPQRPRGLAQPDPRTTSAR